MREPGKPIEPLIENSLSSEVLDVASSDSVLAESNVEYAIIDAPLLPHRDLNWSALPKWFRIFITLMGGVTFLDIFSIFVTEPRHIGLLPLAFIPSAGGLFAAVHFSRVTPLPDRFYFWVAICGGTVGTLFSGILNTTASVFLGDTIVISIIAPFFEELVKLLIVLSVIIICSSVSSVVLNRFTATATGIAVGSGFTFIEDITYFSTGLTFYESASIAIGRSLISPFVHMACTALVGYGVGLVIEQRRQGVLKLVTLYLFAFGLHSLWNITSQISFELALALSFLITCSFLLCVRIASRDSIRIVKQHVSSLLPVYCNEKGFVLSALEVRLIGDEKHFSILQRLHPEVRNELADLRLSVSEFLISPNFLSSFDAPSDEVYTDDISAGLVDEVISERMVALSTARLNLYLNPSGRDLSQYYNDQYCSPIE